MERSTDQVMKPVNTDALSNWVGHIPSDVLSDMAEIAPMLARLGYDPHANPPDYTRPEPVASPSNYSQVRQNLHGHPWKFAGHPTGPPSAPTNFPDWLRLNREL